jgi:predicted TIM-barrel fold metal-dependent hydrolase
MRGNGLRYIDADGHVLEHPTGMLDYAPRAYRDRIWHIETDEKGREWMILDGARIPANGLSLAGTAGMSAEERDRAQRGELRYTEVRPAAYDARARLVDLDADGIHVSVLYPTFLLGIHSHPDADFAAVQCRAYNDWLSDHVSDSDGRLFGVGVVPQQDIERAATEIRRVGKLPGMVGVLLRPNPTADWKPMNHPVYEPLWRAASDAGLPIGLHPFLDARLPGACLGLRINRLASSSRPIEVRDAGPNDVNIDNVYFTQALANPFDMMNTMAFLLAGGVCERHPDLHFVFLEANGGWLVAWLERLDHHAEIFSWDVPGLKLRPSEYFRRQCWISFDPDESTLAFHANSPLVGAERIIWASDYPHPDAKFPGVVEELDEAMRGLRDEQRAQIAGQNAAALYRLD